MFRNLAGDIYLNLGNGNGTFKTATSFSTGLPRNSTTINDFNNDGVLDLAFSTYTSQSLAVVLSGSTPTTTALSFSLLTAADARSALDTFSNVQERVARDIGKIGASQSRLETALKSNMTTRENYLAAESRIRDADIGYESAELVRRQILQQASTAILAQANQQPALGLQLLR